MRPSLCLVSASSSVSWDKRKSVKESSTIEGVCLLASGCTGAFTNGNMGRVYALVISPFIWPSSCDLHPAFLFSFLFDLPAVAALSTPAGRTDRPVLVGASACLLKVRGKEEGRRVERPTCKSVGEVRVGEWREV
mmetsp:Transcript_13691/g.27237  ORF Transcript_13691/g.27237 Transcript_13691/m.27237 type:complete len:135 (-) Transcript_13691:639-1043(-)